MRFLSIVFIGLLIVSCSSIPSNKVDYHDSALIKNNGVLEYYGVPFSGHLVEYYSNGNIKSDFSYLDGRRESQSLTFYPNGQLKAERDYVDGEKDGVHRGYYEAGAKRFEYSFDKGQNVGTHYEWYEDGNLSMESNYQDGQPFGSQKMWRPDGKLRANYVIREDGRKYGLVGIKRCKNIDTIEEQVKPLTVAVYEK